jgi:hypothetical protein
MQSHTDDKNGKTFNVEGNAPLSIIEAISVSFIPRLSTQFFIYSTFWNCFLFSDDAQPFFHEENNSWQNGLFTGPSKASAKHPVLIIAMQILDWNFRNGSNSSLQMRIVRQRQ